LPKIVSYHYIREEPDLVNRYGSSLSLIILYQKDILPVGDILQIEIKGLGQLALFVPTAGTCRRSWKR
jgi:hypothetical protein